MKACIESSLFSACGRREKTLFELQPVQVAVTGVQPVYNLYSAPTLTSKERLPAAAAVLLPSSVYECASFHICHATTDYVQH